MGLLNNQVSVSLDYHPFLQESYQKLSHLPGFVLLESTDRTRGRYDILSAYPHDRITITENTPNKFSVLNQLKKKLSLQMSERDLPFQGGAIGYISYDLGARLLGINSRAQSTLQDMPLLELGLYDWAIIVDHHLKTVTFLLLITIHLLLILCKRSSNFGMYSRLETINLPLSLVLYRLYQKRLITNHSRLYIKR